MRHESFVFTLPTADGNSSTIDAGMFEQKTVHLVASGATLQVQASINGTNFTNVGSAVTTGNAAFVDLPVGSRFVRVVASAYSANNGVAVLGGRNSRTV